MMSPQEVLHVFNSLFVRSFVSIPHETNDYGYCLTITENDNNANLRQINIRNVPKNSLLLKAQDYSNLNIGNILKAIFKSEIGLFKCCDYIVLTIIKNEMYAIFIEMKSRSQDPTEIVRQFKGASCFMEYCGAIAKYFYDAPISTPSPSLLPLQTRYVLFSAKPLNKTTTAPKLYKKHSFPENYIRCTFGIGKGKEGSVMFGKLI